MTRKKIGAAAGAAAGIAAIVAVATGFVSSDSAELPSIPAPANHSQEVSPITELEFLYKNEWHKLLDTAGRCFLQRDSDPKGPQVIFSADSVEVAARIASDEGSIEILVLSDESMQIHLKRAGEPNRSLKTAEAIDVQIGWVLPASLQQFEAWELEILGLAQRWLATSTGSNTLDPQGMCQE